MIPTLAASWFLLMTTLVSAQTASLVPPTPSNSSTPAASASGSTSTGSSVSTTVTISGSGSAGGSASSTITASYPSLSGYSSCVDDCLEHAIADTGCDSVVDVDCFCSSANVTTFASSLTSCMASGCPASLGPAESLANQFCALASGSAASTSIRFATTSLAASSVSSTPSSSLSSPISHSSTAPVTLTTGTMSASSAGAAGASTTSSAAKLRMEIPFTLAFGAGLCSVLLRAILGW